MTQLATDDFNRANNSSLGANWTTQNSEGAPEINSNEARAPTGGGISGSRYTATSAPNDQYSEVLIGSVVSTTSDEGVGPSCRMASAAFTHYFAQATSVETRMWKVVAGSFTQLGSDAAGVVTGDTIRLICNGTSISVTKNGSTIIGPVTDSAIAAGNFGIWASDIGQGKINTWAGGDLSGSGTTITPTVGSLAITGAASTVTNSGNPVIKPSVGALALTTNAPTVTNSSAKVIQPSAGSIALTGTQPTMTLTLPAPGSASLVITGAAPIVVRGTVIAPSVGAAALTGIAPVIVRGTVIAPTAGVLTLTGIAPVVVNPRFITPVVGSLAFTGNAPTVTSGGSVSVQPNAGSLALAGIAPTISVSGSFSIQPSAAALALNGTTAALIRGTNLLPTAGQISFAGIAPSLFKQTFLTPGTAALALSANSPVLSQTGNLTIVPNVGALVLTGIQANVPSGFLPPIAGKTYKIAFGQATVRLRP